MEQQFPPGGAQWPPPQGWVPQPVPAPPARKPRWPLFGGIAGLVVVLLAGLTTWLLWPSKAGREPFEQALAGLSSAPAVRNSTSGIGGMIKTDVKTTAYGETSGTMSFQGKKIEILAVGGKVYFKAPDGLLPGARADSSGTEDLKDRWITGEEELFGPVLQQFESRRNSPPACGKRWSGRTSRTTRTRPSGTSRRSRRARPRATCTSRRRRRTGSSVSP
ncbi:hypothetical protein [Amycolatopsis oliviviridis]|uniref:hypothetical protein n=1 Tax=Amycolatopsis oliviviridis TaxID=1471590 RepID=UPI001E52A2C8|nr:hypothetical protein [Amycolatopsis oliviviridis]